MSSTHDSADHSNVHRWGVTFSGLMALLILLICAPILPWSYHLWFGGVLGGGAAAVLSIPIAITLGVLTVRYDTSREPDPGHSGAEFSLIVLSILASVALFYARANDNLLIIVGVLLPLFCWVWVWGRFGWHRAMSLTLPIGFILFALPWEHFLKDGLEPQLQVWTTDIAFNILKLAQYDVWYHNAYTIDSKPYYLIINETCSGVNLAVTLLMYTLVFGWFAQPSRLGRFVLTLAVFPLAMAANGLRVTIIFLLGYYGGVEWADGFWHTGSAYLLFIPVFWLLYLLNTFLVRRLAPSTDRAHERPKKDEDNNPNPPITPTNK